MAEQQTQNVPIQDTTIEETLAMPEQQEPAPKPARRRQPNAENGNSKRSSTRKTTTSDGQDTNGANGANGATPKKTRAKKQPAVAPVDAAVSTNADVAAPGAPPRKSAPSKSLLHQQDVKRRNR